MRSGKMGNLLASSALLGPMTAAERSKGRYMRAPDHEPDPFADLNAAGGVEVGTGETPADEKPAGKRGGGSGRPPRAKPAAEAKPAAAAEGDDDAAKPAKPGAAAAEGDDEDEDDDKPEGEGEEGEGEGDDEGEEKPKPRKKASERIRELNARLRSEERQRTALEGRLSALEKTGLPGTKADVTQGTEIGEAPNPQDAAKYPLGHLDDRYIEDKLEWLATKKAAQTADAVLQRQQEGEQAQAATQAREELLVKVDDLATRGSEIFDDFQESVVDAGMKGEWRLSQPTFEAAHEAEHGAQILYDLSRDKAEAKRVAELTPYGQLRYVMEKDAELKAKAKPRTKPGAGAPPQNQTRGTNSRVVGNPATDNLDDFEKQWAADAKGKR